MSLLTELLLRFLIGGTVVSAFAVLGDLFQPKSFAGLFAAAPSIALATLVLTIQTEGPEYVAIEARSMVLGAIAFFVYASCAGWLMMRFRFRTLSVTSSLIILWLATAIGLWSMWLK